MLKTLVIGALALSSVGMAETKTEMSGLEGTSRRYKELKAQEDARKKARIDAAKELGSLADAIKPAEDAVAKYTGAYNAAQGAVTKLPSGATTKERTDAERALVRAQADKEAAEDALAKAQTAYEAKSDPQLIGKAEDTEQAAIAKQVADLQKQLADMKWDLKLGELSGDKLEVDVKLEALERKFDQIAMGGYVREKFSRLLSDPAACKALSSCASGQPLPRGDANEQLNDVFFNTEGSLGRNRTDGSKKAAPKSH